MKKIILLILLAVYVPCFATEWNQVISPDTLMTTACFIGDNGDAYLGSRGLYKMNLETGESRFLNEHDLLDEYKNDNFSDQWKPWKVIYKTKNGNLLAGKYTSTDDGNTWIDAEFDGNNDTYYYSVFEYDGKIFASGAKLFVSEDEGINWKTISETYSDYFLGDVFHFDQSNGTLYILAYFYGTSDKRILVYNLATQVGSFIVIKIENLEGYIHNAAYKDNVFYVNNHNKIWTSKDQGGTWEEFITLDDIKENSEEEISGVAYGDNNFLFINSYLLEEAENTNIYHHYTYISADNGNTWKKSKYLRYGAKSTFIVNGTMYVLSECLFQYDEAEQDFVLSKYQFPGKGKYRKFGEMEIYNGWYQNFERPKDGNWMLVSNKKQYRYDGSYYQVVDNMLQFVSLEGNVTDISKVESYSVEILNNGYDIISYTTTDATNSKKLLMKDGQSVSEFESEYEYQYGITDMLDAGGDIYYYLDSNRVLNDQTLQVQKTNLKTHETKTIDLPSDFSYISNFAWQNEKAMIITNNSIYASTNDGINWFDILLDMPEISSNRYEIEIFNNQFYLFGPLGILKSSDGETWKNILEGVTTACVYNVEMDYEGRIYANTYEGHFISKEPISVEENQEQAKEININLFPNPASNYLQLSIDSNVESISVIDLNGKVLKLDKNGNQIDISNLSNGTYFLKIKSGGRTYFKQFVVAR